jgi:Flp pilus assembly protein TadG
MRSKQRLLKNPEGREGITGGELNSCRVSAHRLTLIPRGRQAKRGSSMVEIALLAPWIFFLFVGILDFGFYAYTAISVENAARVAALRTSGDTVSQSSALACAAVLPELRWLPNIGTAVTTCGASPLTVTQRTLCGSTATAIPACAAGLTNPTCADCDGTGANVTAAASSEVTVTYQSVLLIPIPGLLTGQLNLTRKAEMRILAP